MSVRGVNPSYFAGMPTVQRDPRAGQVDPGYAAMPGQALSEANAMNQRRHEFDSGEAFRAKEQALQTEQQRGSAQRDDRRLAMYQQGEDRRQTQQAVENDRLKAADTRKLVAALQAAMNDGETAIAEALVSELKSRGWKGAASPPTAAAPGTSPTPVAGSGIPEIPSQDMSWIDQPKPMSAADSATSKQLDAAEDKYMSGLQGKPRSLVPGKSLRPGVAQSDAMLSKDDPLNKIVQ